MKQTLGRIADGHLGQASDPILSFFSNNRTDSTGVDLNRRWDCPSKEMEPSLYWTKELLRKIDGEDGRRLDIFIDVHAHSTCKRSFMFCNPPKSLEISALGSEPEMRERERDAAARPLGTSGGRSRRSIGRRILRPESDQSRGGHAFGR